MATQPAHHSLRPPRPGASGHRPKETVSEGEARDGSGTWFTRPGGFDPDAEWARLVRSRRARATLATWQDTSPLLQAHSDLDEIVTTMRRASRSVSRAYWAELLFVADDNGGELAARALLQVVVPALQGEIGRWRRSVSVGSWLRWGPDIEVIVYAEAAVAIAKLRTKGPGRWPVLDIVGAVRRAVLQFVKREERWAQARTELDVDFAGALAVEPPVDSVGPAVDLGRALVELTRQARITDGGAALVWRTRTGEATFAELAEETGVSADTLRRRRSRAEQRIVGALADAA